MEGYVSELQEQFCHLSNQIDDTACDLVTRSIDKVSVSSDPVSAANQQHTTQTALNALKDNWKWMKSLSRCIERHIELAANYHMFYQTVTEYGNAINKSTIQEYNAFMKDDYTGEYEEAKHFYESLKDLLALYIQWWQRVDALVVQSKRVRPIHLRLTIEDMKRPAIMLTDYQTKELRLKRNEDVFVVDNTDRNYWQVETLRGDSVVVPSVCCLILGPDTEAVDKAILLRLELLANWTVTIKDLGKNLISFMLAVFRNWNASEISSVRSFDVDNKYEILGLLKVIENTLSAYWTNDTKFEMLRDRIRATRAALTIYDADDPIDDSTKIDINSIFLQMSPLVMEHEEKESIQSGKGVFIVQKTVLNLLLQKYQEFTRYWEVYKSLVDSSCELDSGSTLVESGGRTQKEENMLDLLGFVSTSDNEVWSRYLERFFHQQKSSRNGCHDEVFKYSPEIWTRTDTPNVEKTVPNLKEESGVSYDWRTGEPVELESGKSPRREHSYTSSVNGLGETVTSPVHRDLVLNVDDKRTNWSETLPSRGVVGSQDRPLSTEDSPGVDEAYSTMDREWSLGAEKEPEIGLTISSTDAQDQFDTFPRMSKGRNMRRRIFDDHSTSEFGLVTLHIPKKRIISVYDRRSRCKLSPAQAVGAGVMDEEFLTVVDTETQQRYSFHEGRASGLLILASHSAGRDQHSNKVTFRVDSILDPREQVMVDFVEAKSRGLIDWQTANITCSAEGDRCDLIEGINRGLVKARRLYNYGCGQPMVPLSPERFIEAEN